MAGSGVQQGAPQGAGQSGGLPSDRAFRHGPAHHAADQPAMDRPDRQHVEPTEKVVPLQHHDDRRFLLARFREAQDRQAEVEMGVVDAEDQFVGMDRDDREDPDTVADGGRRRQRSVGEGADGQTIKDMVNPIKALLG